MPRSRVQVAEEVRVKKMLTAALQKMWCRLTLASRGRPCQLPHIPTPALRTANLLMFYASGGQALNLLTKQQ